MGEKVSKLKAGVLKNTIKNVEFHDENSITSQELIELFAILTTGGNKSVSVFSVSVNSVLTDEVANETGNLLQNFSSKVVLDRPLGSLSLEFENCNFSSNGINNLLEGLQQSDIVGQFSLIGSNQVFDQSNVQSLQKLFESSTCRVKQLKLGKFQLQQKVFSFVSFTFIFLQCIQFTNANSQLLSILQKQTKLNHLILYKFEFTPEDMRELLFDSTFEYLELISCDIGDDNIDAIASCLENCCIKKLVLDDNCITDKGIQILIDQVSASRSTLVSISLQHNICIETPSLVQELNRLLQRNQMSALDLVKSKFDLQTSSTNSTPRENGISPNGSSSSLVEHIRKITTPRFQDMTQQETLQQ